MYIGSWKIGDQITFVVSTHSPTNGSGQDADSVPTYHVYEDETATPLITGSMALLNGSNTIGFYSEQFQATSALGFERGKSYNIYVQAVVGSVTGTITRSFQIEAEVRANSTYTPLFTGTMSQMASLVWDEALAGHLTPGSAGHTLFSRMPTGTVLVGDKTGFYLATPQNFDLIGNISGTMSAVIQIINPVGLVTGSFINAIADQVWDEQISGHLSAGSTGEKLNSAGAAGDPWTTALPGSYTPGQAGHILASRMPTGSVIVGTNNDKTGYSLSSPQTFHLIGNVSGTWTGNIVGSLSDITTALGNKIADHVLRRTFANARASSDGDAVSFRSLLGAIAKLVNRWRISGTTLTVYAEDDTTSLGTQALTGTAGADPITEVDTS